MLPVPVKSVRAAEEVAVALVVAVAEVVVVMAVATAVVVKLQEEPQLTAGNNRPVGYFSAHERATH